MPLDPDLAVFIGEVEKKRGRPVSEMTIPEARAGMRALRVDSVRPEDVVRIGAVTDAVLDDLPVRVYRPAAVDGPVATVVYLHGGGWFRGDIDTHDQVVRRLVRDTGAVFVSVDYRLAPEHPWPAATHDAVRAVRAVAARLESYGGSDVLAVAGDSAGGNLAAIATQVLRGEVEIAAQLLIYPATDLLGHHPSKDEFGTGHLLTTEMTDYINTLYFSGEAPAPGDWRHSPLHGDLTGPFDVGRATRLTDSSLYAGRLVQDRSGTWNLLAFANHDESGDFVGGLCDPIPVAWSGDTLTCERTPAPLPSAV